jgi:hypothetical protein
MFNSTNAGLWGYNIDTVQFTSLKPYRIIVSRNKHYISALASMIGKEVESVTRSYMEGTNVGQ